MIILRTVAVLMLLMMTAPITATATQGLKLRNRAETTKIIADLRRIVSPIGLQSIETVRIGGIDQVVSIRTQDLSNPVLIYFHGGPGYVEMPLDWAWNRGWDEYFTVVHWDQRAAGKTYVASGPAAPADITVNRYQRDAEEVVQWARKRFGKQKVFVLGHSWGSVLGLRLAAAHPEWLHAYIGMGQVTDGRASEQRGWAWTLRQAELDRNAAAVRELRSIAPYAVGPGPIPFEAIKIQRKWLDHYGGAAWRRPGSDFEGNTFRLAPEYTDYDVRDAFKGQAAVTERLLPTVLPMDLSTIKQLDVPLILINGRHDINVSSDIAARWFETVAAPNKELIWFERSAHHMTSEEPGKLLIMLVTRVRPIAERAGDGVRP